MSYLRLTIIGLLALALLLGASITGPQVGAMTTEEPQRVAAMAGTVQMGADPSAISWGDGRIDVFVRESDKSMLHKYFARGRGWSSWENLGGILNSGPGVSSWSVGRLDVFALDTSNLLRHKYYARGRGWSGWGNLGAPSGLTLTSDPAAVSWENGRIDVFVRASDNALWHKYFARGRGWSGWEYLGGILNSGPGVSSWSEGRLDVFALDTSNNLRHKYYARGRGWSGWGNLGAPSGLTLTSDPAAVSWANGRIDVFVRASDNALWHKHFARGRGWSGWEKLGGVLNSGPGVSSWSEGRLDIFARDTSNHLRHKYYARGQGWSGWGFPTNPTRRIEFGDGTWIVGTDVPPGTYRNSDSSNACYWERLSGFGGDLDDIIANEFTYSRTIVTIEASDVGFLSSRCGTWSNDLSPITAEPTQPFGDGTYFVGSEVAAGTWRNSDSSGGCYWERLSGFSGEFSDIIANDIIYSVTIVTIASGDVGFKTEDCGTWTKLW